MQNKRRLRHIGGTGLLLSLLLSGCDNDDDSPPPIQDDNTPEITVFSNVTVIPMTNDTILPNQTVVVRDGEIYDIGTPDLIETPEEATVIDGSNRYLMPGLADMHIHPLCGSPDGTDDSCGIGINQAELYLAHGVTTVLSLQDTSGTEKNLVKTKLADPIKAGELIGPTIYTASFAGGRNDLPAGVIHPTQIVETEQDGRNHVIQSKAQGYDFIKVYDGVTADAFSGIAAQAQTEGMAIIGHFPEFSDHTILEDGLDMVAHASAYTSHFRTPEAAGIARTTTATNGVYVNTTLTMNKQAAEMNCRNTAAYEELLQQPQIKYAHPKELELWDSYFSKLTWIGCEEGDPRPVATARWGFVQGSTFNRDPASNSLVNLGVTLVMGTDSPLVWGVPGHSAHEELETISAFLSPEETLKTATRNAGQFVQQFLPHRQPFGTIAIGQRADLLLLENNPLENVSNAKNQIGVMARGHWYSAQELQTRLDNIAAEYAAMTP